jgi:prepilin-type N-terminal cleavage/methylation domain-containing protein
MSASSNRRRGYTLIELVVTLATGAMLMAGLSSTLYMATRSLTPDATATSEANRSGLALAQVAADLREALRFVERTDRSITLSVPDRTGDGADDTIRYWWSGASGDPLLYAFNGGPPTVLAYDVHRFKLSALPRTIAASDCPSSIEFCPPLAAEKVAAATSVLVPAPAGTAPGNLLLAVVAVDGDETATLAAAGWAPLHCVTSSSQVTAAVWWKVASTSEPSGYEFTWANPKHAYAWIMQFSGVHSDAPINASAADAGSSATPACPSVTTTVPHATIVRIGGFDQAFVTTGDPGMSGHDPITADASDGSADAASGAAAYLTQAAAGATGTAAFTLTSPADFVTFTIALTPDDGM